MDFIPRSLGLIARVPLTCPTPFAARGCDGADRSAAQVQEQGEGRPKDEDNQVQRSGIKARNNEGICSLTLEFYIS